MVVGIRVVLTPHRAPNANAYAERFVRSIKEECLRRVILFGERHLRRTIVEYVEHYHRERNHQGIANALIDGASATSAIGRIRRRPRRHPLVPAVLLGMPRLDALDPNAKAEQVRAALARFGGVRA